MEDQITKKTENIMGFIWNPNKTPRLSYVDETINETVNP